MKQKVAAEHRELDLLIGEVRALLRRNDSAANDGLADLRAALEAHFEREEGPYYPVIWSLRPEHKPALMRFIRDHEHFRTHMGEAAGQLAAGSAVEAARILEAFAEDFTLHEREEEAMLRSLDLELAGDPS